MSEQSTALVPRRKWTPEYRRQFRMENRQPGRKGYPPRVKKEVIHLLETTAISVEKICAMPGMPSNVTIWQWIRDDAEFAEAYESSKRIRAARLVEQSLNDVERCGDEDILFAKVMDAKAKVRFKAAALFDPARYSENMAGALNRLPTGNQVQVIINIPGVAAEPITIEGKATPSLKSGK